MRGPIILGGVIGSTIAGSIPQLWGAGMFSLSSVVLSMVGGIAAIVAVAKVVG